MPPLAFAAHMASSIAAPHSWLSTALVYWPICLAPVMFTWLLPVLLRYRRGAVAKIGAVCSITLTAMLVLKQFVSPIDRWYPHLQPWLFGICCLCAVAGIALCAVGIHDRKRSALWALLATVAMLAAAMIDSIFWLVGASGPLMVPWGFIAFWILFGIGWAARRGEHSTPEDLREPAEANNRTRRSRSISRKLLREGRIHLIPLFYLLNLSDLGREGIAHSGSYEFADHIYRSVPSGITILGRWIDAVLLGMPASIALRQRYKKSQDAIRDALAQMQPGSGPVRILALPCGLPRDLTELAASFKNDAPQLLSRIEYVGMDIDPVLLEKARRFTADCGVSSMQFHQGNALLQQSYPTGLFHVAISTGLGEFLDDTQLAVFYGNIYSVLAPGGIFYTSASHNDPRSERLLSAFELNAHYRTDRQLEETFRKRPWTRLTITTHESGLQSFVMAVR